VVRVRAVSPAVPEAEVVLTTTRLGSVLSLLFVLAGCAPFPPGTEGTGSYANQTQTGSNISHKTSDIQSVDKDAFADRMRFGPNGAPSGGGNH
jgi:hypothetical protein